MVKEVISDSRNFQNVAFFENSIIALLINTVYF